MIIWGPERDIFVQYTRDFDDTTIIVITEFAYVPKYGKFSYWTLIIRNNINLKNLMFVSLKSSCTLNYGVSSFVYFVSRFLFHV